MNEKSIQLVSQVEATNESWDRFKSNRERDWGLFGHDMGIHPFNLSLGGWIPTKVTTIAGRSGMGKTALVTPMMEAASRVLNGRRAEILFFSWEMSGSFVVDRYVSYKSGLTLRMLNQGAKLLDGSALDKIQKFYGDARKIPITYQQMSLDIESIKAIGYEFVAECEQKSSIEGVYIQPVIIVDYIGMAQFEEAGLRTYGIGGFMNGFKQFCNATGCSGLIFAQINRSADGKPVPDKSDLSDSQAIEMASDSLVIIHRPEYNGDKVLFDPKEEKEIPSDNKMLVRVVKGRDYGIGDFVVEADMKYFRIHDMKHRHDFKYWELYNSKEFWMEHFGFGKLHVPEQVTVPF